MRVHVQAHNHFGPYKRWLISQIVNEGREERYSMLLDYLFLTPFYWLETVPRDEVREKQGLLLRENYVRNVLVSSADQESFYKIFAERPCNLLEMFIAFARDLSDYMSVEDKTPGYFWMFIDNLYLDWADDEDFDLEIVKDTIDDLLKRRYKSGGIFASHIFGKGNVVSDDFKKMDLMNQALRYLAKYR